MTRQTTLLQRRERKELMSVETKLHVYVGEEMETATVPSFEHLASVLDRNNFQSELQPVVHNNRDLGCVRVCTCATASFRDP